MVSVSTVSPNGILVAYVVPRSGSGAAELASSSAALVCDRPRYTAMLRSETGEPAGEAVRPPRQRLLGVGDEAAPAPGRGGVPEARGVAGRQLGHHERLARRRLVQ